MIKLNRRKQMASGPRLLSDCICDEYMKGSLELHIPQLLRPARQLWPAIRQKTAVGGASFPGLDRKAGALGPSRFCHGTELVTRGQAGNPLLQEGCCQGHLRGRGHISPALAIWTMALVRLPAMFGPGARGSRRFGFSSRGGVRRRMRRQVRIMICWPLT